MKLVEQLIFVLGDFFDGGESTFESFSCSELYFWVLGKELEC